jgi:hypothetical protein
MTNAGGSLDRYLPPIADLGQHSWPGSSIVLCVICADDYMLTSALRSDVLCSNNTERNGTLDQLNGFDPAEVETMLNVSSCPGYSSSKKHLGFVKKTVLNFSKNDLRLSCSQKPVLWHFRH